MVSKSAKCACFLVLQGVGGHANDGGDTTGGHTAAASKSAKCACFLVLQVIGGHANDGGDTTASNSILLFDTAHVSLGGGGTDTVAALKSAKCACFFVFQGV